MSKIHTKLLLLLIVIPTFFTLIAWQQDQKFMSLLKDELKEARIFERPLKGDFNGDGMCDVKSTCYQSNFKRLSPDYQAILVNSNSIVYLFEYDKKRRSFVKTNSRLIGP